MQHEEDLRAVHVNGLDLHYAVTGSGRPVVLLHGNGEDHHLFDTETRQLAEAGYQVFALDSRGHGANAPVAEFHYADMAEDVYAFLQALGLERPALYGHSDGGILGLLLAIRHPDALGALAISGTNLEPEGLIPDFLAECEARNAACPDPLVTLMLTEPHIDPEALRGIHIPVLTTVGEHDLVRPEEAERIAAHLPDAKLVVVPGADHGSYLAGCELMGGMLIDFLRERWQ